MHLDEVAAEKKHVQRSRGVRLAHGRDCHEPCRSNPALRSASTYWNGSRWATLDGPSAAW
jgi:hypothetical protein